MNAYLMIFLMAITTYLIRMIPFAFFQRKIKSKFLYSVFHYMPYAVLSSMIFPSVLFATGDYVSACAAALTCILLSLFNVPMIIVSVVGSLVVFVIMRLT